MLNSSIIDKYNKCLVQTKGETGQSIYIYIYINSNLFIKIIL